MHSPEQLKIYYKELHNQFPFSDYIKSKNFGSVYKTIASVANKYLEQGDKILDFGCGPCDKTGMLQKMGFQCVGYDDLGDGWHSLDDNIKKINFFADQVGIDFVINKDELDQYNNFNMIMLTDVIEHFHDSPKNILIDLLGKLKVNGILLITVPNAGNIRKRISLLFGKTNYPPYHEFYWNKGSWRGHIREYVYGDLELLAKYLDLECLQISGVDHMLHRLPNLFRPFYLLISYLFPSLKDSWVLVCRKKDIEPPKRNYIS